MNRELPLVVTSRGPMVRFRRGELTWVVNPGWVIGPWPRPAYLTDEAKRDLNAAKDMGWWR